MVFISSCLLLKTLASLDVFRHQNAVFWTLCTKIYFKFNNTDDYHYFNIKSPICSECGGFKSGICDNTWSFGNHVLATFQHILGIKIQYIWQYGKIYYRYATCSKFQNQIGLFWCNTAEASSQVSALIWQLVCSQSGICSHTLTRIIDIFKVSECNNWIKICWNML